jgi:hypothetical protein
MAASLSMMCAYNDQRCALFVLVSGIAMLRLLSLLVRVVSELAGFLITGLLLLLLMACALFFAIGLGALILLRA